LRRSQIIKINIARELGVRQAQPVNKAAHIPALYATAVEHIKQESQRHQEQNQK
jgi:hypothetical protein